MTTQRGGGGRYRPRNIQDPYTGKDIFIPSPEQARVMVREVAQHRPAHPLLKPEQSLMDVALYRQAKKAADQAVDFMDDIQENLGKIDTAVQQLERVAGGQSIHLRRGHPLKGMTEAEANRQLEVMFQARRQLTAARRAARRESGPMVQQHEKDLLALINDAATDRRTRSQARAELAKLRARQTIGVREVMGPDPRANIHLRAGSMPQRYFPLARANYESSVASVEKRIAEVIAGGVEKRKAEAEAAAAAAAAASAPAPPGMRAVMAKRMNAWWNDFTKQSIPSMKKWWGNFQQQAGPMTQSFWNTFRKHAVLTAAYSGKLMMGHPMAWMSAARGTAAFGAGAASRARAWGPQAGPMSLRGLRGAGRGVRAGWGFGMRGISGLRGSYLRATGQYEVPEPEYPDEPARRGNIFERIEAGDIPRDYATAMAAQKLEIPALQAVDRSHKQLSAAMELRDDMVTQRNERAAAATKKELENLNKRNLIMRLRESIEDRDDAYGFTGAGMTPVYGFASKKIGQELIRLHGYEQHVYSDPEDPTTADIFAWRAAARNMVEEAKAEGDPDRYRGIIFKKDQLSSLMASHPGTDRPVYEGMSMKELMDKAMAMYSGEAEWRTLMEFGADEPVTRKWRALSVQKQRAWRNQWILDRQREVLEARGIDPAKATAKEKFEARAAVGKFTAPETITETMRKPAAYADLTDAQKKLLQSRIATALEPFFGSVRALSQQMMDAAITGQWDEAAFGKMPKEVQRVLQEGRRTPEEAAAEETVRHAQEQAALSERQAANLREQNKHTKEMAQFQEKIDAAEEDTKLKRHKTLVAGIKDEWKRIVAIRDKDLKQWEEFKSAGGGLATTIGTAAVAAIGAIAVLSNKFAGLVIQLEAVSATSRHTASGLHQMATGFESLTGIQTAAGDIEKFERTQRALYAGMMVGNKATREQVLAYSFLQIPLGAVTEMNEVLYERLQRMPLAIREMVGAQLGIAPAIMQAVAAGYSWNEAMAMGVELTQEDIREGHKRALVYRRLQKQFEELAGRSGPAFIEMINMLFGAVQPVADIFLKMVTAFPMLTAGLLVLGATMVAIMPILKMFAMLKAALTAPFPLNLILLGTAIVGGIIAGAVAIGMGKKMERSIEEAMERANQIAAEQNRQNTREGTREGMEDYANSMAQHGRGTFYSGMTQDARFLLGGQDRALPSHFFPMTGLPSAPPHGVLDPSTYIGSVKDKGKDSVWLTSQGESLGNMASTLFTGRMWSPEYQHQAFAERDARIINNVTVQGDLYSNDVSKANMATVGDASVSVDEAGR